jgi:hypothetical protein
MDIHVYSSGLQTVCWNSHGYELCPIVSGPVFVFIWGGIYSKAACVLHEKKNLLLCPSIRHFDISTAFFIVTMINFIHMSIWYIHMNWKSKTSQCSKSASYLDVLLTLDTNGKITIQLYGKRDDFNFSIINFPCVCSNITASHAYGVYISQLIRYTISF